MVVTQDFVYVANPRTASRSTERLVESIYSPVDVSRVHHVKTNHPKLRTSKPIYGTIREPFSWIVSWFHHVGWPGNRFQEFVKEYTNGWLFDADLNIYRAYITHTLRYSMGVTGMVEEMSGLGLDETDEPWIGRTGPERTLWTPEIRNIAKARFSKDFKQWYGKG